MRVNGLTKGFFILIVLITLAFSTFFPYYSAIFGRDSVGHLPPGEEQTARSARRAQRPGGVLTIVIICLIVFTPLAIISRRWPSS
jgi:formate hydrogenlyase subunit 3/multisubunit Na+/H+ antiporter MnhD subunit